MSNNSTDSIGLGRTLATRLGLTMIREEGHDLAGPCIACESSDAFRLHQDKGIAYCYSCNNNWSPSQLAEDVLGDPIAARNLMVELGVFPPSAHTGDHSQVTADPIAVIAQQKGITAESLVAFGAEKVSATAIHLPAYGPDGRPCTTFRMSTDGGKGLFAKGKPAGLFFPHENGVVRLPVAGETWHLVEGPKDAAALHQLGLLACGINTCCLAPKFAQLFRDVDVIVVPDRDQAGENGAEKSSRVLRGIARSIRIAVLPAEFKQSKGDDVRDVLRRKDGEQQLRQAIDDAQVVDLSEVDVAEQRDEISASAEFELPDGQSLSLSVSPASGQVQQLVVARCGKREHRDVLNINRAKARREYLNQVAQTCEIDRAFVAETAEARLIELADEIRARSARRESSRDEEPPSPATLVANWRADWELWHTHDKVAYVTIPVDNHFENWPVQSKQFRYYIAKRFFEEQGYAIGCESQTQAVQLIESFALFDGCEHAVHIRVAEHAGNIYIDLCDESWRAVEIDGSGWKLINDCPVKFRRSSSMQPLPEPEPGGSIELLRAFLNVDDDHWPLVGGWLIGCVRPQGPYPILAFVAEQGTGKSTAGRILRSLVDPNTAPLRAEPKSIRDLMIAAKNSWCICLDNLSRISSDLSDGICRLSTGGGFATREMYTDQDEIIFEAQRPVMLTSVDEIVTRSDLLDRSLIVSLPRITDAGRRPEEDVMREFESARPRILGALYQAVSAAIRNRGEVTTVTLPRMADFAQWVIAAESDLNWPTGTFMNAYDRNRELANDFALEANPFIRELIEMLAENSEWEDTATALLLAVNSRCSDALIHQGGWPKNARAVSSILKRSAPNLRVIGWDVSATRAAKQRTIIIRPIPDFASCDRNCVTDPMPCRPVSDGKSMPSDADSCEVAADDANDGDDANPAIPADGED